MTTMHDTSTSLANPSRRAALKAAAGTAALFTLGFRLPAAHAQVDPGPRTPEPDAWLRVERDGTLVVLICQTEMGQGISTGLSAALCEEMDADWSKVRFEFATGRPAYWNPIIYSQEQITGGSRSTQGFFTVMRRAGAIARSMMLSAAAARWGVPADQCRVADGVVTHGDKRASYGELSEQAAGMPLPSPEPTLKKSQDWKLIGKPLKRLDTHLKIDGSAVFGIDVKVPGMLHGTVRHAPVLGSEAAHVDDAAARAQSGVRAVVKVPGGVGVVADHYWQALSASKLLQVEWTPTPNDSASSATIVSTLRAGLDSGKAAIAPGGKPTEVAAALAAVAAGGKVVQAEYVAPFLAHGCLEPLGCVASVADDHVELWLSTQSPTWDAQAVMRAIGMDAAKVKVNMTFAGGGFGRRAGDEHVRDAVLLAKAVGKPVKMIWSREEDTLVDTFRPSMAIRMKAVLGADGYPTATHYRIAGGGFWAYQRPNLLKPDGLDITSVAGLFDSMYQVKNRVVESVQIAAPIRVGTWRSTSYSGNNFFNESFFDELAHAAGKDPMAYRRALLQHDARSVAVLDALAERSGWGKAGPDRWQGVAYLERSGWKSRVAEVVEISKQGDGFRIEKVTVVVDSGLIVNPNLARQNLEGGVIFGLSAALYGDVPVEKGVPQVTNFNNMPILRINQTPVIDIQIIQGDDKQPGSFGEVSTAAVMPALTNALFAATGQRLRSLPVAKSGIRIV